MPVARRLVKPPLRWTGGKRWLVPTMQSLLAEWEPTSYIEPFLGGGAMFFSFEWPRPLLSDVNRELISTYRALSSDPERVRSLLRRMKVTKEEFDRIKQLAPRSDTSRATRLLYLNRCSYGGIYRTNARGHFNVPYSGDRTTSLLLESDRLLEAGEALKSATLRQCDFEDSLRQAEAGTLAFCDPAYTLPEADGPFRRYSTPAFSWSDQIRLAEAAHELKSGGSLVVVCNSSDSRVEALYKGSLVLSFKRRSPLPSANGIVATESVFILGDKKSQLSIRRRLGS